jgi:hypothetical protein
MRVQEALRRGGGLSDERVKGAWGFVNRNPEAPWKGNETDGDYSLR